MFAPGDLPRELMLLVWWKSVVEEGSGDSYSLSIVRCQASKIIRTWRWPSSCVPDFNGDVPPSQPLEIDITMKHNIIGD